QDALLLGYGIGGLAIIWWEAFEWLLSTEGPLTGGKGLELGYTDTVGDLILSSSGGLVGPILAIYLLGPVGRGLAGPPSKMLSERPGIITSTN
ncbi:MAG: hypothetical protein GY925_30090, partial [Actinomycetia bacterium]|nr:hypothetical protein [Actinomycetes bacterium]